LSLDAIARLPDLAARLADSIKVTRYIRHGDAVLDVGSGDGFPVIVAAIDRESDFVALEPDPARYAFLQSVRTALQLYNLEVLPHRFEDHGWHDYDVVMARDTFPLADWLSRGAAFVRPGGLLIAFDAGTIITREHEIEPSEP
jgi:16S rRNA (guanine527-N7)-methyltransferase